MTAPIPNYPIYNFNKGIQYIFGLELTRTSNTVLAMAVGQARSQYNVNDIILSTAATLNSAINGAGGLDSGAIAASTLYAIHVISSSTSAADTSTLLSTSATDPVLPLNYDMFCRVGWVYTDGSSNFALGRWEGHGSERTYWYDTGVSELSAGTSATFAAVDVATSVPVSATTAILTTTFNANAAGDTFALRPTGSASTDGIVILSAASATADEVKQCLAPVGVSSAIPSIDYKVTASGALTILVAGYIDHLLAPLV